MKQNLLRAGGLLVLVGLASCMDTTPVAPTMAAAPASRSVTAEASSELAMLSPSFAQMNAELEAAGSNIRIVKADLLMDGNFWDGTSSTEIFANDRDRGIGAEWVPGDPRRDGRIGVNYSVVQYQRPRTRNADGSNLRLVTYAQLDTQIEEGMSAWRTQSCSAPITRVPFTGGEDITQYGWYPASFFLSLTPGSTAGNNIIGVTFSGVFVNPDGTLTDIDRNKKADLGISQIVYNNRFIWGTTGARNVVDFYSIITHETGHAVGLGHFGKVFVNRNNVNPDGSITSLDAIKYAPKAIMNAVYVTGREEIRGTDHSSFCQIWASAK